MWMNEVPGSEATRTLSFRNYSKTINQDSGHKKEETKRMYHVRQARVKQLSGGLHHPLHVPHSADARLGVGGIHPEDGAFADPEFIQLSRAVEAVHADTLDFSVLLVGAVEDRKNIPFS